ncbi:MAG: HlyC/CorC family transporter [Alphaproteobacteria bacterium]
MDLSSIIINLSIILLLICMSGFLSGTETAMTASSKARLVQLSKKGNKRASKVLSLLENTENLIGGILIGNNFVNILASSIATNMFLSLIGENGVFIATFVMTAMVVIFAEVMPKVYAMANADKMAMGVVYIIEIIIKVLSPINNLVMMIVKKILAKLKINTKVRDITAQEEELRGAIELHDGDDPDYKHEREMLRSVMDLDDTSIEEATTHRKNVIYIDISETAEKIMEKIISSPFENFPVTDGTENIIGVINQKDVLTQLYRYTKKDKKINIKKLIAEPWYVPESTSMLDQLQAFREKGSHFAFVVDEYGSYMGIITITDILEHIVGDVHNDEAQPNIRKLSDNSYIFDGNELIRHINRELDWDIDDEDASTIAGFIMHNAQTLPKEGQVYSFAGYEFIIAKRERQQILKVRVKKVS